MANSPAQINQQEVDLVDLVESLVDNWDTSLMECIDEVKTKLEYLDDSIDATLRIVEPYVQELCLQIGICNIEIASYRSAAQCIHNFRRKLEAIRKASPKLSNVVNQTMQNAGGKVESDDEE